MARGPNRASCLDFFFLQPMSCLLYSLMAAFYSYMKYPFFFLLAFKACYILFGILRKTEPTSGLLEGTPPGFAYTVPPA